VEDVTLSATGDVPDKNRDSSRTRDGRPLSATKSVGLKVVSFTTYILSRGFNIGFIKVSAEYPPASWRDESGLVRNLVRGGSPSRNAPQLAVGYFTKEDYDKFITSEFEKRLLEEHTEFSQTINNVRNGKIRAGPQWLFKFLDAITIKLYGFNFFGFIILNPAYLYRRISLDNST